jgi:hypothetical protein
MVYPFLFKLARPYALRGSPKMHGSGKAAVRLG